MRQLINIVCPRGPRQQPAAVGKRDRQTDTTPSQTLPHTMQAVSIRTIYSAVQSQTRSPQQAQAHLRGQCPLPQTWPQQVPEEVIWRLWNARKPFSGRDSAQDPTGGAYSAPPDPTASGKGAGYLLPRTPPPWAWSFGLWTSPLT